MNVALGVKVAAWIAADPDEEDRAALQALVDHDDELELERRFATPLKFGTAGLRGPVMAGPSGMNRYTVRRTTQGVIAWLHEIGVDIDNGVVVGRDARRGSEEFNDEVVNVLLGAGVRVHELPGPLPTPLVAYGVRALGTAAGIMITASHNPSRDNGFKLYANDGAQIIPPSDEIVERHALAAHTPVLGDRSSPLHQFVTHDLLDSYQKHFANRFGVETGSALNIVYTPLHGVGGDFMAALFEQAGYTNVSMVGSQFAPDAAFPTLPFPNPEEVGALDLAMARADEVKSDLVIANDPDADRLGVAVRSGRGWHVLRGDEIGWLLASSLFPTMHHVEDVVATTIVSSTMLRAMALHYGVRYAQTLTGFKWISRAAGDGVLRFGYEEALGFSVDPAVADKDGISAALAIVHFAHVLSLEGKTLLDRLDEIEASFGVHATSQLSQRADGPEGGVAIAASMAALRDRPPSMLGGIEVSEVADLSLGYRGLAATDGVMLVLGAMGRVVVRPSGTEAKLKAYIEVTSPPLGAATLQRQRENAAEVVSAVRRDLGMILSF